MVKPIQETCRSGTAAAAPRIEWRASDGLVAYDAAVAWMEERVRAIASDAAPDCVWLLEHPPLYTAGTGARAADLLAPDRFPVHASGRGGQYTYHGPGQRVVYAMLDLRRRGQDVRAFVCALEDWTIAALGRLGVRATRRPGQVGVWVPRPDLGAGRMDKIAAIGVRVRRWVTFHGLAINVAPDLAHYAGIVPCGVRDAGVTSLAELGVPASMADMDAALRATFEDAFGPRDYRQSSKDTPSSSPRDPLPAPPPCRAREARAARPSSPCKGEE